MCKRYHIQAKRKNTNSWSEWTSAVEYGRATEHLARIESLGYDGQLVPSKAVVKLWDILGNDTALADKILDAGFGLEEQIVKDALVKVKMAVRKKTVKVKDKKLVDIAFLYEVMRKILCEVTEDASFEDEIWEQEDNA